MLLPMIACADCPEPRNSTSSASSRIFRKAHLAIHGIHCDAEIDVTPQRNFF
jgi:hypothetical protein